MNWSTTLPYWNGREKRERTLIRSYWTRPTITRPYSGWDRVKPREDVQTFPISHCYSRLVHHLTCQGDWNATCILEITISLKSIRGQDCQEILTGSLRYSNNSIKKRLFLQLDPRFCQSSQGPLEIWSTKYQDKWSHSQQRGFPKVWTKSLRDWLSIATPYCWWEGFQGDTFPKKHSPKRRNPTEFTVSTWTRGRLSRELSMTTRERFR